MTVKEFVEKYKTLDEDGKLELIMDIINNNYVSYATKVSDCNKIIQATSYIGTDPKMFKINSPSRYMLLNLQLIIRYTNLEIKQDGEAMMEAYDILDEIDALTNILACIPSKEMISYNHIMKMMLKDLQMNERSIIGYIDTKLASLNIIGDALNKFLEENSDLDES